MKKVFLEISQNSQELYEKETLARVFSCEFCKISKNTFTEHIRATASGYWKFAELIPHAI